MYSFPSLDLQTITTVKNPLLPPPKPPQSTTSVQFRRSSLHVKASVSTFAESKIPVKSSNIATSLYDVLRVENTASLIEIKSSYRRLAKMYHPDTNHDDGRQFIEIHNAYETLSDPTARAIYDLTVNAKEAISEYKGRGGSVGFYRTRRWETDQCW